MAVTVLTISSAPCAMAAVPGNDAAEASRSDEFANYEQYEINLTEANYCADVVNALCVILQDVRANNADVMAGDIEELAYNIEVELSYAMMAVNDIFSLINEAYDAALASGTYEGDDISEQIMALEDSLSMYDILIMELQMQCENAMVYLQGLTADMQALNARCQELENLVLSQYESYDAQFLADVVDALTSVEARITNVWSMLQVRPISMEVLDDLAAQMTEIDAELKAIEEMLDNYSGIADAAVDAADATYYDLNGRAVTAPEKGRIYIQRQGTASSVVRY